MKNFRLLCAIALSYTSITLSKQFDLICHDLLKEKRAQSFMFTRPIYYLVPLEMDLWRDVIYDLEKKNRRSFQIAGFYQQSLSNLAVSRYFLINHKNTLLVAGDAADPLLTQNRDVRAEWINLPSNFSGYMSIDPFQRQSGFFLEYNQDIGALFDIAFLDGFFLGISTPFVVMENKLNLTQSNIQNPGAPPFQRDIISAFNQDAWLFGKMPAKTCQAGLAEITLRLGKAYMSDCLNQIAYYSFLRIPTAQGQNPEFMFCSFIGNNRHWGLGTGFDFQLLLNRDITCYSFCFYLDIESTFLVHNVQWRTLDLQRKPDEIPQGETRQKQWSRYMLLTKQSDLGTNASPIPAVNVLTRQVKVKPFNLLDLSAGWRLRMNDFTFDLGYNLWAHGSEHLSLEEFSRNEVFGIMGSAPGISASTSTIDRRGPDDATFVSIFNSDLLLKSGASRGALGQGIHGSFGVTHTGTCADFMLGAGFWIEFPYRNTTLKDAGAWVKVGASF